MSLRNERETDRLRVHRDNTPLPAVSGTQVPSSAVLSRPGALKRKKYTDIAVQGAERTRAAFQRAGTTEDHLGYAGRLEQRSIALAGRWFDPSARIAIFIIYFWFGFLKAIGLSPATPLAFALTSHTIGAQYFNTSFKALAVYECLLGILFLIPAMTRASVILLIIHMGIVTSPLIIVADVAWTHPLVPTLEGQYIIKDLAIIALAIGILAQRGSSGARRAAEVRSKAALSTGDSPLGPG